MSTSKTCLHASTEDGSRDTSAVGTAALRQDLSGKQIHCLIFG